MEMPNARVTETGLGLSADKKRLYVACSDGNVAAVANIAERRSRVEAGLAPGLTLYPRKCSGVRVAHRELPRLTR